MTTLTKHDRILGGLWGSLTGDALGVPVEFRSRPEVQLDPVTGMRGGGTHGQPAGTWSDDSSLLLCSVESLVAHEFSPADMAERFVRWGYASHWTPHGVVFDRGFATSQALARIAAGVPPLECGGRGENDNGNGSLMRILPVSLRFAECDTAELAAKIEDASAITHGHRRSQMACVIHGFTVRALLRGDSPRAAWLQACEQFRARWGAVDTELPAFADVLNSSLPAFSESAIRSGGYVMETLTASLWCLLTTDNFRECVLKAVNLGGDTDTTGCVAGGLAGVCYGVDAIPPEWIATLARNVEVAALFQKFTDNL